MTDIFFDISNITFSGIVSIWLNKSLFDSLITYFTFLFKLLISVPLSIDFLSSVMKVFPLPTKVPLLSIRVSVCMITLPSL